MNLCRTPPSLKYVSGAPGHLRKERSTNKKLQQQKQQRQYHHQQQPSITP